MHEATVDASADAALARMGYKSELPRNLSMMSILGLCVILHDFISLRGMGAAADPSRDQTVPSPSWPLPSVSAPPCTSP
jgi:hypothetical protein